mmetsp:Transcript_7760/g.12582  ORF Transcript_7760/g.12582 Transcript_7760/m.12582 type:complete len:224 (-) Transcript_7760:405-1076(-)
MLQREQNASSRKSSLPLPVPELHLSVHMPSNPSGPQRKSALSLHMPSYSMLSKSKFVLFLLKTLQTPVIGHSALSTSGQKSGIEGSKTTSSIKVDSWPKALVMISMTSVISSITPLISWGTASEAHSSNDVPLSFSLQHSAMLQREQKDVLRKLLLLVTPRLALPHSLAHMSSNPSAHLKKALFSQTSSKSTPEKFMLLSQSPSTGHVSELHVTGNASKSPNA